MLLDRAARFLVVAAFLAAQAVALSHSIWHVGSAVDGAGPIASVGGADDGGALANPLCAQHGALDDVLGALHGGPGQATAGSLPAEKVLPSERPAATLAALAPSSRGPPAFL